MCGRYNFTRVDGDSRLDAIIDSMEKNYPGAYKTGEIFPGDTAPAVIGRSEKIVAVPAVFGFPGFSDGKLIINARSETAAEKKLFADCLREQRAVLPASGFFEWSRHTPEKTKYLFTSETMRTIYLCGLYKVVDGVIRFVILTRGANDSMIAVHDRMPVIAGEEEVRPYLTDLNAAAGIIAAASPVLACRPAGG